MRKDPLIVANWKMYKTPAQARMFWRSFQTFDLPASVEVVLCPTFLALSTLLTSVQGTSVRIGAQDGHWHVEGAYTGDVSMAMLRSMGVSHVIVGHSERRIHHEEDDAVVQRKVMAAREHGLVPIVCIGERVEERLAGKAEKVVSRQVERALATVPASSLEEVILAYEPIWSIGTGQAASPHDASAMVQVIHTVLRAWGEEALVDRVRVLYGGSVDPDNVHQYLAVGMNGVLVGRASLEAGALLDLIAAAACTVR